MKPDKAIVDFQERMPFQLPIIQMEQVQQQTLSSTYKTITSCNHTSSMNKREQVFCFVFSIL